MWQRSAAPMQMERLAAPTLSPQRVASSTHSPWTNAASCWDTPDTLGGSPGRRHRWLQLPGSSTNERGGHGSRGRLLGGAW